MKASSSKHDNCKLKSFGFSCQLPDVLLQAFSLKYFERRKMFGLALYPLVTTAKFISQVSQKGVFSIYPKRAHTKPAKNGDSWHTCDKKAAVVTEGCEVKSFFCTTEVPHLS